MSWCVILVITGPADGAEPLDRSPGRPDSPTACTGACGAVAPAPATVTNRTVVGNIRGGERDSLAIRAPVARTVVPPVAARTYGSQRRDIRPDDVDLAAHRTRTPRVVSFQVAPVAQRAKAIDDERRKVGAPTSDARATRTMILRVTIWAYVIPVECLQSGDCTLATLGACAPRCVGRPVAACAHRPTARSDDQGRSNSTAVNAFTSRGVVLVVAAPAYRPEALDHLDGNRNRTTFRALLPALVLCYVAARADVANPADFRMRAGYSPALRTEPAGPIRLFITALANRSPVGDKSRHRPCVPTVSASVSRFVLRSVAGSAHGLPSRQSVPDRPVMTAVVAWLDSRMVATRAHCPAVLVHEVDPGRTSAEIACSRLVRCPTCADCALRHVASDFTVLVVDRYGVGHPPAVTLAALASTTSYRDPN